MKTINKLAFILMMASLLTGCLGLGSKEEDDGQPHYYVIDVDRGAIAASFAKNRVVRIKPVRITSHFRGQDIVFKVGDDEYQRQERHQFFSEPEEMFTGQAKRWLQKSGLFSQVITDDGNADMVMEIAVTKLYGDKREQFSPQAVLEMQFFLISDDGSNQQALFQTGLRIDIDIKETSAPNVVKGWKQGLEELLATVEDDLSGYFLKHSP
ncbi:MAG: ABC transporter [Methylophaga sp.]|nr:ABC transporter [Methylophaga sp.]